MTLLLRQNLVLACRLLLLVAVLVAVLSSIDLEMMAKNMAKLSPWIIVAGLLIEAVYYFLETAKVYYLARGRYTWRAIFRSRLVSVFVSNVLPGMAAAEAIRLVLLERSRPGNPIYVGFLLAADRLYLALAMFAILALVVAISPFQLPVAIDLPASTLTVLFVGLVCMPLAYRLRWWRRFAVGMVRRAPRTFRNLVRNAHLALASFSHPTQWALAMSLSVAATLAGTTFFWLVAVHLGLDINFSAWTFWAPIISLATFLPVGIGGVGSQEVGFILMAQSTNSPLEPLLAVSLAVHATRILGSLIGALFIRDLLEQRRATQLAATPPHTNASVGARDESR